MRRAKDVLEDITGRRVLGYRAPSFSIVPGREWAFDVLIEEGHVYDSSIFPVRRADYGYPGATPIAHVIDRPSGRLYEFPLATTAWNGVRIPAAGGGYLRHFPYNVVQAAFREHDEAKLPAVFYIHPWELDPEQPRLAGSVADPGAALPGVAWHRRPCGSPAGRIPIHLDLSGTRARRRGPYRRAGFGGREVSGAGTGQPVPCTAPADGRAAGAAATRGAVR